MVENGTPEFYRREAYRMADLACAVTDPALRFEMLRIAVSFKKLADDTVGLRAADAASRSLPDAKSA